MVLLLGWIPVSFCPWYLWGSASGAGQIAEDGTRCTAGHLLRIVSGGGQSADLPRKAAGAALATVAAQTVSVLVALVLRTLIHI